MVLLKPPIARWTRKQGRVLDEIHYLSADEEEEFIIAQANSPLDEKGTLWRRRAEAGHAEEILEVSINKLDYMDVSPKQVFSVATSLIPFLENDDANRALMGANMQRQAVPVIKTEAPIVGTGLEYKAAKDSGAVVVSKKAGMVKKVSASTDCYSI